MNENNFNSETGSQQNNQSSQDKGREYENTAGDNSTVMDDNKWAAPQDFPQRSQQHDYKDPSGNQLDNDDDDDIDTDGEIFDQDKEDESTDPVDEQSLDTDEQDQLGLRRQ